MARDDGIDGGHRFRLLARRRVAVISQPVPAVKPGRTLMGTLQRLLRRR